MPNPTKACNTTSSQKPGRRAIEPIATTTMALPVMRCIRIPSRWMSAPLAAAHRM